MKNLKLMTTGLAAALCISLASTAVASPSLPGNSKMSASPCLTAFNAPTAGLTKEQTDLHKQISGKHKNTAKPFVQQMPKKKAELAVLMAENDSSPAKGDVKYNSELKKQGLPAQEHNGKGFGHKGQEHKGPRHGKALLDKEHASPTNMPPQ